MNKISKISILGSFLGLWINSFFSQSEQITIGFTLIFSFGILHGANDLILIKKVNNSNKNLTFVKILISYVTIVISGSLLFYIIPFFALMIFILISGYHFGEQHWEERNKNLRNNIIIGFEFVYGLLILFLLFFFNKIEVQKIIFEITNFTIPINSIKLILGILLISIVFLGFYIALKFKTLKQEIINEIFNVIVLSIVFYSSSLIWGFAIYFVLWHSIPSLVDQTKFLYGDFSLKNFVAYFKSAFVYWIISVLAIFIIYYFFNENKLFNALFFSFLAAITFPHVLVILKMFQNQKLKN